MAKSGDMAKRGIETGEVSLNLEAMMGEKSKAVGALTGISRPDIIFVRYPAHVLDRISSMTMYLTLIGNPASRMDLKIWVRKVRDKRKIFFLLQLLTLNDSSAGHSAGESKAVTPGKDNLLFH